MNLAVRDIRRHTTRFVLTCIGLGLLLTVVMAMSGIYRGLIGDATKVVDAVPGTVLRYSGGGVTIEELLLEDVTGAPFAVLTE